MDTASLVSQIKLNGVSFMDTLTEEQLSFIINEANNRYHNYNGIQPLIMDDNLSVEAMYTYFRKNLRPRSKASIYSRRSYLKNRPNPEIKKAASE